MLACYRAMNGAGYGEEYKLELSARFGTNRNGERLTGENDNKEARITCVYEKREREGGTTILCKDRRGSVFLDLARSAKKERGGGREAAHQTRPTRASGTSRSTVFCFLRTGPADDVDDSAADRTSSLLSSLDE